MLVVLGQPLRRDHDDRDTGGRRILPKPLEEIEAGHVGEPQVEQDDVGRRFMRLREPVDARRRLDQLVLVIVQQLADDEA